MTTSVLKQDPNRKRFKRMLFIRKSSKIMFWVIPFVKIQNDTFEKDTNILPSIRQENKHR